MSRFKKFENLSGDNKKPSLSLSECLKWRTLDDMRGYIDSLNSKYMEVFQVVSYLKMSDCKKYQHLKVAVKFRDHSPLRLNGDYVISGIRDKDNNIFMYNLINESKLIHDYLSTIE